LRSKWALKIRFCRIFDYTSFGVVSAEKRPATVDRPSFKINHLHYRKKFCFTDNLLSCALTEFYSVAVLVFGQQPELVVADGLDIGQPPVVVSSAQHGLVQSGGQTFGQQSGAASPAPHVSVRPNGQTFASDPASVFRAHSTLAFSAKTGFAPEWGVLFFA
jgi:hypothetical protein